MAIMSYNNALKIMFAPNYFLSLFFKKSGAQISLVRFDHEWHLLINTRRYMRPHIAKITNLVFFDILTRTKLCPEDLLIFISEKEQRKYTIEIQGSDPWITAKKMAISHRSYSHSSIEKGNIAYQKYVIFTTSLWTIIGFMKTKQGVIKYFYKSAYNDDDFSLDANYFFDSGHNIKEYILDSTWKYNMCTYYNKIHISKRDAIRRLNKVLSAKLITERLRVEILKLFDVLNLGNPEVVSKQLFISIINKEYGFRSITRDVIKYTRDIKMNEAWDKLLYILHDIDLLDEEDYTASYDMPKIYNISEIIPEILSYSCSCSCSCAYACSCSRSCSCSHACSSPCHCPLWNDFISCIKEIAKSEQNDKIPPKIFSKILNEIYQSEIMLFNYIL